MKKKQLALALGASVAASASLLAAPSSERYVYDASGNIVEKQIGDQVTQFDYAGNLLKESVLGTAQKQYQYDEAGRLVGELEGGQVVRQLNYQFADKVTKVQNGEKTTELFYNAEGQLVGTNSAGNLEAFAWDDLAIVSRGEQAYANEKHIVGGVPALIGSNVAVSDMIGNTLSVGDKTFENSAFGEGLEEGLFTGKPFLTELDGFLFNYRTYSSEQLRWDSLDPSGFPDGTNSVSYAGGDPVNFVDPLGLHIEYFFDVPEELESSGEDSNGIHRISGKTTVAYSEGDHGTADCQLYALIEYVTTGARWIEGHRRRPGRYAKFAMVNDIGEADCDRHTGLITYTALAGGNGPTRGVANQGTISHYGNVQHDGTAKLTTVVTHTLTSSNSGANGAGITVGPVGASFSWVIGTDIINTSTQFRLKSTTGCEQ